MAKMHLPPVFRFVPLLLCGSFVPALQAEPIPSFDRDIRPILAKNCFACHGPDESHREADLRLDLPNAAEEAGVLVPAEPSESELLRRITTTTDERMPPVDTHDPLTEDQQDAVRRWISAGAPYEQHWAFEPPEQPAVPSVAQAEWPRNEIDHFVLAALEERGLSPSASADRYTLVRRLYLDLIGLPPTPAEADAFVLDNRSDAYERLVTRLLNSRHYGEKWARHWLDLARYADTNGYEKDRPRSIWPYRDWVIRALNADMPFDQFTIEQLAGDMLPEATTEQQIATGFHRNTMLNEEGGIDPLEYRFYSVVDRVATTATVWLGLTVGCAQCHTHKYDPISHTEYYQFMALLNNADEPDLTLHSGPQATARAEWERRLSELETALVQRVSEAVSGQQPVTTQEGLGGQFQEWLATARKEALDWRVLHPVDWTTNLPKLVPLEDGSLLSTGDITKRDLFELHFDLQLDDLPITAIRLEAMPDPRLPAGGPGRSYYEGRKGDFFLSEISGTVGGRPITFYQPSHSYGKIAVGSGDPAAANVIDGDGSTGWSTAEQEGRGHQLVLNLRDPVETPGRLQLTLLFERHFAASLGRFRIAAVAAKEPVQAKRMSAELEQILTTSGDDLTPAELAQLQLHFVRTSSAFAEARQPIDLLRQEQPALPHTLVLRERPSDHPRPTFRHHRGEYLSPREPVEPGVPAVLGDQTGQQPRNRLELARWLVSPGNPLVPRVTVNRAWAAFFGSGLVPTVADFGTQGERPSHPRLLDWLAVDFVEQGWSLKQLHRAIVMSSTYRQTSASTGDADRETSARWLARFPRQRVDAEVIRDSLLAASGKLSTKMYGPSVYPPQPASVTELAYGQAAWPTSEDEDRYRRSLYTFSKRTAPFAAYAVFDAPTGETCVAERNRSNTPLQALTVLNDRMFLEFARGLARRSSSTGSAAEVATAMFRRVLTRPPTEAELTLLLQFQKAQLRRLATGELDAPAIADRDSADPEEASWILLARALMNTDEALTKP